MEHLALAAVRIAGRLEGFRPILRDGRQHCDLIQRQIGHGFVIVDRAAASMPYGVAVEVMLMYSRIWSLPSRPGYMRVISIATDGFLELAHVGLLVAFLRVDEDVLDQLLRDRARKPWMLCPRRLEINARARPRIDVADIAVEVRGLRAIIVAAPSPGRESGRRERLAVAAEGSGVDGFVQQMFAGAAVDLDRSRDLVRSESRWVSRLCAYRPSRRLRRWRLRRTPSRQAERR